MNFLWLETAFLRSAKKMSAYLLYLHLRNVCHRFPAILPEDEKNDNDNED